MTPLHRNLEEAKKHYSSDTIIVETPDYVFQDWGFDETKKGEEMFIKPEPPDGWGYDEITGTFYNISMQKENQLTAQLCEYQKNLNDTDYLVIKLSEGELPESSYIETGIKEKRRWWRDEVNRLRTELECLKSQNG
jgi:hypothetical protein